MQQRKMKQQLKAKDLRVDANMSTGSPNAAATHVAREDRPHLADPEWEALQRLPTVIGEAAVATMLRMLSPSDQHGVALGVIMKEQREVATRATVSIPSTPRVESLYRQRQAKRHLTVPRPILRPMVKPSEGPEPMILSSATAAGSQQRRGSANAVVSGVETTFTTPVRAQRLCTRPMADVAIPGIATGSQTTKATSRRGPPCW
ncbi:unnamed protein product [Phytophthora fragariaefolia]|uniref:Unnamed protein product n=1 Tax=Phytophthora fragariaefolia TaxID=1490495 RepID=A0A9W6YE38_9STRA|nr:unnamed protein product [Phytophthora fragariaefolia]